MIRGALTISAWAAFQLGCAQWQMLGDGILNGQVRSLLYDSAHQRVYVFGHFATSGTFPGDANSAAYWEGAAWHVMGEGLVQGPVVSSILLGGDSVLVSGFFTGAIGVPDTRGTALWNGTEWRSIGPNGSHGIAWGMLVNEDGATLAGAFDTLAGLPMNRMARLHNGQWSGLCSYPTDQGFVVYNSVIKYQDRYIFGGNVNVPGLREIGWLDGDTLRQLGPGLLGDPWVNDLVIYQDDLYVGGEFYAPANAGSGVMKWDGVGFSDPFPGVQYVGMVHDMDVRNGELYISGQVIVLGVAGYYQLARFDGERLCLFGKNMNVVFRDIAATETELYVAPNAVIPILFGDTLNRILRYDLGSPSDTCILIPTGIPGYGPPAHDEVQVSLHPNPSQGTFTVQLGTQWLRNGKPVFDVYDATGRLIHANLQNTMNGPGNYEVELGNPSKGVRFLRIRSADGSLDVTRSILVQ